MKKANRTFQIFAKPVGSLCNLCCDYCYYLEKEQSFSAGGKSPQMPLDILETYIKQHIQASIDPIITFSWHGGEPTLMGLEYFQQIVALQKKNKPRYQRIANGIQTNGTLLNDAWCEFFNKEQFVVGLSLDGPPEMHDRFRKTKDRRSTGQKVLDAYARLKKYGVYCDILCVVNSYNVQKPIELYRFFKMLQVPYITFLPLVEREAGSVDTVSERSVTAGDFGSFLCRIFDEWKAMDIETIKINIFEETARTAFGQEQALCIFRKTCGEVPVIEHNGDFFCCDHFVNEQHHIGNIQYTPLVEMLESDRQRAFGHAKHDSLPDECFICDVLSMCNGGCPKDRFLKTRDGQTGLNYLCDGYKLFFRHFRPFAEALTRLSNMPNSKAEGMH